jgi:chromosome partitioning protein
MKTIAIISQKGGAGKTTLALHLAVAAVQDNKTAVIADLDEQASATMWHKARENPLPHVQPTHSAALSTFLPEAERQGVDLMVLDTAPQSDKPAINAAEVADLILVPCKPSVMDLRAVQNTIRLTKVANLKPGTQVFAVLTQVEPFGRLHEEARSTLQKLDLEVLPYGLGRRVAYHHGLIDGRTALEFEPNGKAATETKLLYQRVWEIVNMPSSNHESMTAIQERR